MISPALVQCVPYPQFASQLNKSEDMDDMIDAAFFVKSAELYEITHELTVRLYPPSARRSKASPGFSLADLTTVIQLDDKITEWESTIPDHLVCSLSASSTVTALCREAVILRLRYVAEPQPFAHVLTQTGTFTRECYCCVLFLRCFVSLKRNSNLIVLITASARKFISNALKFVSILRKEQLVF